MTENKIQPLYKKKFILMMLLVQRKVLIHILII